MKIVESWLVIRALSTLYLISNVWKCWLWRIATCYEKRFSCWEKSCSWGHTLILFYQSLVLFSQLGLFTWLPVTKPIILSTKIDSGKSKVQPLTMAWVIYFELGYLNNNLLSYSFWHVGIAYFYETPLFNLITVEKTICNH